MNVNVDAVKSSCNVLLEANSYFECKKYRLECCPDKLKIALASYHAANSNCVLSSTALDTINQQMCDTPSSVCATSFITTSPCNDTTSIAIGSTASSCKYIFKLANSFDGTNYPRLRLLDNSIHHRSEINFLAVPCKGASSLTPVSSGCSSTGCVDDRHPYGKTTLVVRNVSPLTTGYLKTITIYATDTNGNEPLTAYNLDISPSNIAAWTGCGSCSAINPADLYFGSVGYTTTLRQLLENVTKILFGVNTAVWEVSKDSSHLYISSRIKHNPTSYWAGINPDDCPHSYYTGDTTKYGNPNPRSSDLFVANPLNSTTSIYQTVTASTPCGTVSTPLVSKYGIYHELNAASSNINKIVVTNYNATQPITLSVPDSTCTSTVLTANITTTGTVDTIEWYDSTDQLVGTTASVTVFGSDTYRVVVTTNNGCTEEESITI